MNTSEIDRALTEARQFIPASAFAGAGPSLSKCDLASACQAFLKAIEPKAGFIGAIGVRAAHGALTKWRKANGC